MQLRAVWATCQLMVRLVGQPVTVVAVALVGGVGALVLSVMLMVRVVVRLVMTRLLLVT